jgi:hypothetical protein
MSDKMRRNDPGGDVDGVEIDDIIAMTDGVYHRRERVSPNERRERYTCFVQYCYDPGDPENGPALYMYVEEIDVDAIDSTDARIIATLALERDYEPGGKIIETVQRQRGWMYF